MARAFASIAGRALKTASGKADSRTRLIGAVHASAKAKGIDEETRRAIQLEATGKASLKEMTLAEIGQVLDRLNRGERTQGLGGSRARPHIGKVRALWWTLYWLGEVAEPNDTALESFVRRQTSLASLRFLDHRHAPSVIEALKAMAARAGVKWPSQAQLDDLAVHYPDLTIQRLERHRVLDAIFTKLRDRRLAFTPWWSDFLRAAVGGPAHHFAWSERELDEGIRILGKKLRAAMSRDEAVE